MTAYRRNILTWICIAAVALPVMLAALYVSNWFVLIFFSIVPIGGFFLNKITCPNCGTSVTYQGTLVGFRITGGFIRKKCQECGWDLDKNLSN